jgi:hypothetical protein
VADHRAGHPRVDRSGVTAAEERAEQPGEEALQPVADEDRPRATPAERLERVPRAGVPVADPAQVDAVAARHEEGDRHGAGDITEERRRNGVPWP